MITDNVVVQAKGNEQKDDCFDDIADFDTRISVDIAIHNAKQYIYERIRYTQHHYRIVHRTERTIEY